MNTKTQYFYIFSGEDLLLEKDGDRYAIPIGEYPPVAVDRLLEVTVDEKTGIYTGEASHNLPSDTYEFMGLRTSYDFLDKDSFRIAGKAFEINHWDRHSRFCPACGTATEHPLPVMKICPNCKHELYPVISAAILVLIRKEDSILLIRAKNFRGPFHGLVAGFLETGETLEECVVREVREEVALEIKNIRYFGNQPWPFPSGLMVGFIADYAGGEICIQEEELSSAAFYNRGNLPEIPRKLSLARKMIDWWIANPS
ncbi:NAD(+) diphosphatase [Parabacteroides sp. PF5-6]|uniref:NAD(+) diphosphatase n=1 Tax=Parabacteroides sp. PF5-6 TaxID=1742403 RepID=UPI00240641E0|nr:NAD(+) diphosphatase [Parabacteroides sp. PF5-6]MDF9829876.1 NAD+ diphosphatase [Parabacteroides sp. PF5-6]